MEFLLDWRLSKTSQRSGSQSHGGFCVFCWWFSCSFRDDFSSSVLVFKGVIPQKSNTSPDPWASHFLEVSSCFPFRPWRQNLFLNLFLKHVENSAWLMTLWTWRFLTPRHGCFATKVAYWKWIQMAHLGLLGSPLLLILAFKLSMVSAKEFNQQNAVFFFKNCWKKSKTTTWDL